MKLNDDVFFSLLPEWLLQQSVAAVAERTTAAVAVAGPKMQA